MQRELKGLLEVRDGEIVGIASTADPDRDGEVIVQSGWDLKNFLDNPVILAHHNYHNFPIGKAIDIAIKDGKLMFKMAFSQATEEAKQAYALVKEGILSAFSVGFIVRERDDNDQNIIKKAELLEISLVTVPANPRAIVYAKSMKGNDLAAELCAIWLLDKKLKSEVEAIEAKDAKEAELPKDPDTEEKKGAVQDVLDNPPEWKVKEDNCRKVWDVVSAFMNVYYDETTPAADFSNLLKETAKILKSLADEGVASKELMKALVDDDEDDDEEDDDEMKAMKEAKFKQFLAVVTGKESTPGDGNVEETREEGEKVEEGPLSKKQIRLFQEATGAMQEVLRVAKATKKGGAK